MTVSVDRTIGIGGIVIGLIGTGIVILWPNKRWLGWAFIALGLLIALVAIAMWAVIRLRRPDPNEERILELQTRLTELESVAPQLRLQFVNGLDSCLVQRPADPRPEPSWEDIERFKEKYPKLWQPPLNTQNFANAFRELAVERLSDYQIEKYNNRLDDFFRRYEEYLNRCYQIDDFKSRSICLDLELKNSGTSPATDVSVLLKVPISLNIACKPGLFEYPKAPSAPKKPYPGETVNISDLVVGPHMPRLDPSSFFAARTDQIRWLETTDNPHQRVASFEIQKLNHGFAKPFPKPIIITFNDRHSIKSFTIDVEIHAANLPAKQRGQLQVVISD